MLREPAEAVAKARPVHQETEQQMEPKWVELELQLPSRLVAMEMAETAARAWLRLMEMALG